MGYKEVWVDLKVSNRAGILLEGFSSKYSISSYGRVYNKKDGVFVYQVLTGKPPYFYVNLQPTNGKRLLRRVHNLMATSFISPPESKKYTVDHIDRNKYNNSLWNLRWATYKEQGRNKKVTLFEGKETLKDFLERKIHTESMRKFIYDRMARQKNSYAESVFAWENFVRPHKKITFKKVHGVEYNGNWYPTQTLVDHSEGIEYKECWYPDKEQLCKYKGNCSVNTLNSRLKTMSLEEALNYKNNLHAFSMDGFYMNQREHCERLNVSYLRVRSYIPKYKIPFQDAVNIPLNRIIKHAINGVIKRNCDWYNYYGIDARKGNTQCFKKSFRNALEYFGVDTSEMEIHPCDGDVIMKNKPV